MSNQSLREAAQQALKFMELHECRHENTHRGGAIWEICDDCGSKWADDRGGKPKYVEPKAISDLRAAFAQVGDEAQPPAEQGSELSDEQIDDYLNQPVPGGSIVRDWFSFPRGLQNVRNVVRIIVTADRAARRDAA